jgi:para-aminobenzoate synthetase component 1
MEIIAELEPDARRVYCGSAGYVGFDGQMDTNIMIRTLLCEGQDMYCWGGGGLVADSVCSQEYQECFDKINNIINVLK